jgi:hypothetical protein
MAAILVEVRHSDAGLHPETRRRAGRRRAKSRCHSTDSAGIDGTAAQHKASPRAGGEAPGRAAPKCTVSPRSVRSNIADRRFGTSASPIWNLTRRETPNLRRPDLTLRRAEQEIWTAAIPRPTNSPVHGFRTSIHLPLIAWRPLMMLPYSRMLTYSRVPLQAKSNKS